MPTSPKVYDSPNRFDQHLNRIFNSIAVNNRHLAKNQLCFPFQKAFVFFLLLPFINATAQVSDLTASFRNGQVFLTWTNISDVTTYYKIYRSPSPIAHGSQLSSCEYLGWTNQYSAKDNDWSRHDNQSHYLRIDSAGSALSSTQGLFVATTLQNGNYYYAVTTYRNQIEDTLITAGGNSLSQSVAESVMRTKPVFQQNTLVDNKTVEVYAYFTSFKLDPSSPPISKAGFFAGDFLLYRNGSTGNQPLCVQFHGGGADMFWNIAVPNSNAMNLNVEQYAPSGEGLEYWGANSGYNMYQVPDSNISCGTNYNFMQWRYNDIIDWAIRRLPIDSNRIYLIGTSAGACGAYMYCVTYPDRIAAVRLSVPAFNFSFLDDWESDCSLNTGNKNRLDIDHLLGTVTSNLPSSLGQKTFDAINGAVLVSKYKERNYPFIYSINGKKDVLVGWTEKTIYYDSVNANHIGGYYLWDNRTHSGSGGTWGLNIDIFRFHRDKSYPAFANCSLNEDFGNGNGNSGASYGSVNGMLDWKNDPTDDSTKWEAKIFIRDLVKSNGQKVIYGDSAIADVTPRRLQHFEVIPGTNINWQVTHHGNIVQSGTQLYSGGLITINSVKIFKDTSTLQITYSSLDTFYADDDSDGYGDPLEDTLAYQEPMGYSANRIDCNDASANVNPDKPEICNGIDDNCNGQMDEGVQLTFYADTDGDGYGNASAPIFSCSSVTGFVSNSSDCNDANSAINPAATEMCNGYDDNCDGQIDVGGTSLTFYRDSDGDGYGNINVIIAACSAPAGYVTDHSDCNDGNQNIHPNQIETCNGIDDNCSGEIDEGVKSIFYADADNDGYGNISVTTLACSAPSGYVSNSADCNDLSSAISPSAAEVCNSVDDNCNGQIDEGTGTLFYADGDHDGYGNPASFITACSEPAGYVANSSDCNDNVAAIHPNAVEVCNSIDDNCNGQIDESSMVPTITPLGSLTFCGGASVVLQANSGSKYSYQWQLNGVNISGATKIKYTAKTGGIYTVQVRSGSCSAISLPVTVVVLTTPAAKISAKSGLDLCVTGSVQLKATLVVGNLYQWYLNNEPIFGAITSSYTATVAGSYTVKVTNVSGCSKISAAVTVTHNCKSSGSADALNGVIIVYPNPSSGAFIFEATNLSTDECKLEVFDAIGVRVYSQTIASADGRIQSEIDLPKSLPDGIYFVRFFDGQEEYLKQLVVER